MRHFVFAIMFLALASFFSLQAVAQEEETSEQAQIPQMEGLTQGQLPWERAYDEALLQGRDAYNEERWEEARDAFRRAIQISPERPAAYRNLARSFHWMARYPEATAYYDHYLRLAPEADDAEQIRSERRTTASRSGGDLWQIPSDQRMALRSLERELDLGRGVTAGGGGGWALYQTLMRMGYAEPELSTYRRRLEENILAEFEERLSPADAFLPVMRSESWSVQRQRLEALQELARREGLIDFVERRTSVVEAAEALLDGRYQRATALALEAAGQNEDLGFVGWYRVMALERSGHPQQALDALEELLEAGAFGSQVDRRIVVLQAQLLQQVGRSEEAARIYVQILSGD